MTENVNHRRLSERDVITRAQQKREELGISNKNVYQPRSWLTGVKEFEKNKRNRILESYKDILK